MKLIEWNDEFSVNVAEIDNQHKFLFETLNNLFEIMKTDNANNYIQLIIDDLINYIKYHFGTEEEYFHKFDYIKKEAHIIEHTRIAKIIDEFYVEYKEGKQNICIELLYFLKKWITHHILITDKEYSECFNKNGLY